MSWDHVLESRYAPVDPTARFVLIVVAMHANRDGYAWPSVGTIAAETGFNRGTVQRALGRLIRAAAIGVVYREGRSCEFVFPVVPNGTHNLARSAAPHPARSAAPHPARSAAPHPARSVANPARSASNPARSAAQKMEEDVRRTGEPVADGICEPPEPTRDPVEIHSQMAEIRAQIGAIRRAARDNGIGLA